MNTFFIKHQMKNKNKKNKSVSTQTAASARAGHADFYQVSHDWMYDQYHSQSVWLKRVIVSLIITAMFLLLSLITIMLLVPLKEKIPYLYAFDNATGEITQIGTLQPTQFSENWQMTRYFLMHYVMSRESYDSDNMDYPYQMAWAMSAPDIQQQYDNEVDSNQFNSPYRLYGKDKFITVKVLDVARLSDDTASVRFATMLNDRNLGTQQVTQNEAIIKWQYTTPVTTQKMLDRDPLGFKVTYYQVSQVDLNQ